MSSSSSSSTGVADHVFAGLTINQTDWFVAFGWTLFSFFKLGGSTRYSTFHSSDSGARRCCTWNIHLYYWLTFLADALVAAGFFFYWRNRIDQSNYDITMALIASYLILDKLTGKMHADFDEKYMTVALQTLTVMMSVVVLVFFGLSTYAVAIGFFSPVVFWQLVRTWAMFDYAVGGTNMCAARLRPARRRDGGGYRGGDNNTFRPMTSVDTRRNGQS